MPDDFDDLLSQLAPGTTEAQPEPAAEETAAEGEASTEAAAEAKPEPKGKAEPAKKPAAKPEPKTEAQAEEKPDAAADAKAKRRKVIDFEKEHNHQASELRKAQKRHAEAEKALEARKAELDARESAMKEATGKLKERIAIGEDLGRDAYSALIRSAKAQGLDPGKVLRNVIERAAAGGAPGAGEQADIVEQLRAESDAKIAALEAKLSQRAEADDHGREQEAIREVLDLRESDEGKAEDFRGLRLWKTERLVTELAEELATVKARNPAAYKDLIRSPRKIARALSQHAHDEFLYAQKEATGESPPAAPADNGDPQAQSARAAAPPGKTTSTTVGAKNGAKRGASQVEREAELEDRVRDMLGLPSA